MPVDLEDLPIVSPLDRSMYQETPLDTSLRQTTPLNTSINQTTSNYIPKVTSSIRQSINDLQYTNSSVILKVEDKKKVSEATKIYIIEKLIEPSYKNDIKTMIKGKKCWRITGMSFETMSKIMVATGGVLSFSSGYFNSQILSFISGSISTISLACLQFSSFSYIQNKKQSEELNILLKTLDLETVPILPLIDDGNNNK
jgi:hypothetical protein